MNAEKTMKSAEADVAIKNNNKSSDDLPGEFLKWGKRCNIITKPEEKNNNERCYDKKVL